MVVISAAIINKKTKIIFARQFEPITRLELEEYIVQFSRNIDTCKESTHIETDKVRYIFIPIEELYLVIITSKNSNLIEDIEILKMIYRLIQDLCSVITVERITTYAIDLALGIDDIMSMGIRESVTIPQIKQLLEMESQEEKEFKKEQEIKELGAKKQMLEKMKEFEKLKKQNKYVSDAISSKSYDIPVVTKSVEIIESEVVTTTPIYQNTKTPSKGLQLARKKKAEEDQY